MPSIWLTGISHSLNSAASWSISKRRMQQVLAGLFLIGESRGIDGGEAQQKSLLAGQLVVDGLHGVVGDLVVVALVADGGGELGIVLEVVLPVVVEEVVEGLAAVFKRGLSSGLATGGCELRADCEKRRKQRGRGGQNE